MQNSFQTLVANAKALLIVLPQSANFDQVASALSLYLALKETKKVEIYSASPMVVEFNRLVGVDKITKDIANKNLIVKFADYKPENIEKVSYDIEGGQFQLTVIPKDGFEAPGKDQVLVTYAGVAADTVIIVGGKKEADFPILMTKEMQTAKVLHVGNEEITLDSNREVVSFARAASSVSEIVAGLVRENGFNLNQDIATNLFMGLVEGSGQFSNGSVSAETFSLAAELIKAGAKRETQIEASNYPPGSIPTPKSWFEPKVFKSSDTPVS